VLVLGLYAGLWVDRLRRRPILVLADIGRALLLGTIPLAALMHRLSMPLLYVVAAAAGILTVFFDVAYQTYVPALVERENILEANSKLALSASIAEVTGPGLTGVLVQTLTAPIAILFDALSFLFSAATVGAIRKREPQPVRHRTEEPWHEALAGMRFLWAHPILRALGAYAVTTYFAYGIFGALYIVYAIRDLHMNAVVLQLAISCGGAASLLGSTFARRISATFGLGTTFIASALITGLGCFLIPAAQGSIVRATSLIMVSQFVCDFHLVVYNVHELSLRQTLAPDEMLGRVNASMRLLTFGILPVGSALGGIIAGPLGIRGAMFLAAAVITASTLWLLASPLRSATQLETAAAA
jgi:MFS family permease